MALPNYAKMYPRQPTGVVPAGVSPSAWALEQSRANQAASQSSRYDWLRGNIPGGTPAFLISLMGPNTGLPPDITAAAESRYYSIYPKGPELSGAAGNLPYLQQRAYDAARQNEMAAAGRNLKGEIPAPQIGGVAGEGEPFVPVGEDIRTYQNRYTSTPTTGMTGGASPYPTTPTTPTSPAPSPAPAPSPNWFRREDDPSGSIWDVFNESLKRATMPTNFRATWG